MTFLNFVFVECNITKSCKESNFNYTPSLSPILFQYSIPSYPHSPTVRVPIVPWHYNDWLFAPRAQARNVEAYRRSQPCLHSDYQSELSSHFPLQQGICTEQLNKEQWQIISYSLSGSVSDFLLSVCLSLYFSPFPCFLFLNYVGSITDFF